MRLIRNRYKYIENVEKIYIFSIKKKQKKKKKNLTNHMIEIFHHSHFLLPKVRSMKDNLDITKYGFS